MQQACLAGDFLTAMSIQDRLLPLHDALFAEPSPAGVKYAASLLGMCAPDARLPVVELTTETKQRIEKAVSGLGLVGPTTSNNHRTEELAPA